MRNIDISSIEYSKFKPVDISAFKVNFTTKVRVNRYRDVFHQGEYKVEDALNRFINDDLEVIGTEPNKVLSELEFYIRYLCLSYLNNLLSQRGKVNHKITTQSLSPTMLVLLAELLTKPLDYTIIYRSKSNQLDDIAKKYKKPAATIYKALKDLKDNKYIVEDEDKNLCFNDEITKLRLIIKGQLEDNGIATYDYLTKYVVCSKQVKT